MKLKGLPKTEKLYLCFMKSKVLLLLFITVLLYSCRKEDENNVQKIDQVVNIYLKDTSGKDLLNTNLSGAFTSVSAQDLNADKALQSISGFSVKKDKDTVAYIDYAAGATRLLSDSVSATQKKYRSDFYLNLSKIVNKVTVTDTDTLKIEYSWTPTLFQVSKLWYNNKLVFTKVDGQQNIIKIVK